MSDDPKGGPARSSTGMFLAMGGDRKKLSDARDRAIARLEKWLKPKVERGDITMNAEIQDELLRFVGLVVHNECANVGVAGFQEVINRSVEAIQPEVHEEPTNKVTHNVCPRCGTTTRND